MSTKMNTLMTLTLTTAFRPLRLLVLAAMVVALASLSAVAEEHGKDGHYRQVNLVSDLPGVAQSQDTNLVNAWGISFSSASPFWISDNGTGKATLYSVTNDPSGMPSVVKVGLEVTIPGEGNPTGQLFNNTSAFHGDLFIFASEDGTISGWRGALGTTAEILVPPSTAIYKGIALSSNSSGPLLLAANFHEGTIDAYDSSLNLAGQFADSHAPANYAPFNVQTIAGAVFVTFTMQDADKHDDVSGRGHGLIDIFDPQTTRRGALRFRPPPSASTAIRCSSGTSAVGPSWPSTPMASFRASSSSVTEGRL